MATNWPTNPPKMAGNIHFHWGEEAKDWDFPKFLTHCFSMWLHLRTAEQVRWAKILGWKSYWTWFLKLRYIDDNCGLSSPSCFMPLIFLDMIWAAPKIPLLVGDRRNYTTYSHSDRIIMYNPWTGNSCQPACTTGWCRVQKSIAHFHMILSCPFTFLMSGYGPVWLPVSSFGWLQYHILHSSGLDENCRPFATKLWRYLFKVSHGCIH